MKPASRLTALQPYLFATLAKRIEEKRAQGIDVIALASGDPDLPTCPLVVDAAAEALRNPKNHTYPTNRGKAAFLAAAAEFMEARFGVSLDPVEEIFPVLGGKEAVHHLGFALLSEGDYCLYTEPGYPIYESAIHLAGAMGHALPLLEGNAFLPDLDAIPSEVLARARVLYLNYPNNPTGAVATKEFFSKVVDFARRNDLIVIHDNAYSEITFDGYVAPSFLESPGAADVGVEIFSLSKGWNMTGWRIGFIAGNRGVISALKHLKPNIDAGPFGAIQDAAIAALTVGRAFPREMSRVYQERRDVIIPVLRNLGLHVNEPVASLFLWGRITADISSADLANRIFDEAGVVISPGSSFGPSGEGYVRVALTAPIERLTEAAQRLQRLTL